MEQSGELFAGTVVIDPLTLTPVAIGDGIDASSVADAEASLDQQVVQGNLNRQEILDADADPVTPAFGFTADATFNHVTLSAGDDAEIEAGIEDVEVELEQEQEDIDQENESRQVGLADAQSYADDVDVEQSGFLSAAADGVKASSEADANADLDQLALQGNTNAQTAATSLAFAASPSFTNVLVEANNDDAEIGAGIEEVEVSVDQDQEDIDQSNKSEQVGPWSDDAEDWGPALATATSESGSVSVKQTGTLFAGDTGVDAQSEADATATLQQLAGQGNANSQEATTAGTFTADAPFNVVTLVAGDDAELEAGIEDVEFEVEQEQEDIDQENDGDQFGVADALATSGYVQVDSFDDPSGGTAIEAASDAEATAGLLQVAEQSNGNSKPRQRPWTSMRRRHLPMSLFVGTTTMISKLGSRMLRSRSSRIKRTSIRRTSSSRTARLMPRPMPTMPMWT